jgi:hypothetical protein
MPSADESHRPFYSPFFFGQAAALLAFLSAERLRRVRKPESVWFEQRFMIWFRLIIAGTRTLKGKPVKGWRLILSQGDRP